MMLEPAPIDPVIVALIAAWIAFGIYVALYFTRKPKLKFTKATEEEQRTVTKSQLQRLKKENERYASTINTMKRQKMEQDIIGMAEGKIVNMLPDKVFNFDPDNQLIGRPIFFTGSIPVYDKRQELNKMMQQSTLAKIMPSIAQKIFNWRHFGQYDTLFYYNTLFLPNGKWAITATTKPAKKAGKHMKIPAGAKTFVLLSAQQTTIDQTITNKWEVAKAHAAITLNATFLGPLPIEDISKHMATQNE